MPATTRERVRSLWVVLAGVVVLLLLALLAWVLLRPGQAPSTATQDEDVTVIMTDVAYQQSVTGFVVTSVNAVTRGDSGYVRLGLTWLENPDDSSDQRLLPAFSVEVLHREPYAGVTTACGLSAPTTVPAESPPSSVELPCAGLLVPTAVAKIKLID